MWKERGWAIGERIKRKWRGEGERRGGEGQASISVRNKLFLEVGSGLARKIF